MQRPTHHRHGNFSRDFLPPCGCDHWKPTWAAARWRPSYDSSSIYSPTTLDEIGRHTMAFCVGCATPQYLGTPWIRERGTSKVMTSPIRSTCNSMVADTAHFNPWWWRRLTYYPRLLPPPPPANRRSALEDPYPRYRGNTATPHNGTRQGEPLSNARWSVGVDFPRYLQSPCGSKFKGWGVVLLSRCAAAGSTAPAASTRISRSTSDYLKERWLHVKLPATVSKHA